MINIKKYWITLLSFISIALLYKILKDYNWSLLADLSPILYAFLLLIAIISFILWITFLKTCLEAIHLRPRWQAVSFIYCFSHAIGRFATPLLSSISEIFLFKQILQIHYLWAISAELLQIFVRYTLLFLCAFLGITVIFTKNVSTVMLCATLLFILTALLIKPPFIKQWGIRNKILNHASRIKTILLKANHKKTILCFCLYLAMLLTQNFSYTLILNHFGYHPNFITLLSLRSIGFIIGVISMLPMGIGTKDLTIIWLLTVIGIDKTTAISSILMDRLFNNLLPLLSATLISHVLLPKYSNAIKIAAIKKPRNFFDES